MTPLVVLFTYYRDDAITRVHFAALRASNPGVPIVPLVADRPAFLPGTVDIGPLCEPQYNVDRFPARWWDRHDLDAERVAVIESDCLVTQPLACYWRDVWDADVAASVVATPESHPDWLWWRECEEAGIPPANRFGVMPSGVILYSARAVESLSRTGLRCFAELRIGASASMAGLRLAEVPGGADTVHCREDLIRLSIVPGVYHPVKRIGGIDGRCRAAHERVRVQT
jgi:hypothetical protein